MTEGLEHFFSNRFNASQKDTSDILAFFKHTKVSKNEVLVNCGEVCHFFYFVVKGSVKTSFNDSDGQETIRHVAFENQFITNFHSYIEQSPSSENITAIEASDLLAISHTDFKTALETIPVFKEFYIKALEATYIANHKRIESFLRLNAKQRYDYVIKNNNKLVRRLSNKNLSAYLGITQESLSRIKAQK